MLYYPFMYIYIYIYIHIHSHNFWNRTQVDQQLSGHESWIITDISVFFETGYANNCCLSSILFPRPPGTSVPSSEHIGRQTWQKVETDCCFGWFGRVAYYIQIFVEIFLDINNWIYWIICNSWMLSKICCSPVKVGKEQQNAKNGKKSLQCQFKETLFLGRKSSMAQKTQNGRLNLGIRKWQQRIQVVTS